MPIPVPVPLHYLASPYSHRDPVVMEARRVAACKKAGELIAAGVAVISPIAHNVAVLREVGGATGWVHWEKQDIALLQACRRLLVLRLPGWDDSEGVAAEMAAARRCGLEVDFIDEDTDVAVWRVSQLNWRDAFGEPLPAQVAGAFDQC